MERVELSVGPGPERMEPVSPVPAVQGQSLTGDADNEQKRRAPPTEASFKAQVEARQEEATQSEATEEEAPEPDDEEPQHRVDKLA